MHSNLLKLNYTQLTIGAHVETHTLEQCLLSQSVSVHRTVTAQESFIVASACMEAIEEHQSHKSNLTLSPLNVLLDQLLHQTPSSSSITMD